MPTPLDATGPQVVTDEQKIAQEKTRAHVGFWDAATRSGNYMAALNETYIGQLAAWYDRSGIPADPNWNPSHEDFSRYTKGIEDDLIPMFADARSEDSAQEIRQQALTRQEARRELAMQGKGGLAAEVITQLLSPPELLAALASGGLGYAAKAGAVTRTAMAIRAGLATGATFGALEASRAAFDETTGFRQIATAAVGGAGFGVAGEVGAELGRLSRFGLGAASGVPATATDYMLSDHDESSVRDALYSGIHTALLNGAFNAIPGRKTPGSTELELAANRSLRTIEKNEILASGGSITPKGEKYYAVPENPLVTEMKAALVEETVVPDSIWSRSQFTPEGAPDRGTVVASARTGVPPDSVRTQQYQQIMGMRPEELRRAYEGQRNADNSVDEAILGAEVARKYRRLHRDLGNDFDRTKADAAAKEIASIESKLTPQQVDALYGIGDHSLSADEIKSMMLAGEEAASSRTIDDLADAMKYRAAELPVAGTPISAMTPKELRATYALAESVRVAKEKGFDGAELSRKIVERSASQFPDKSDAELMLDRFFNKSAASEPTTHGVGAAGSEEIANIDALREHQNAVRKNLIPGDIFLVPEQDSSMWANILRWGGTSKTIPDSWKKVVNMLTTDYLAKADGSPAPLGAYQQKEALKESTLSGWSHVSTAAYAQVQKDAKAAGAKPISKDRFEENITRWVRRAGETPPPEYAAAVASFRKIHADALAIAKRHRVKGFATIEPDPAYVTRHGNEPFISDVIDKLGTRTLYDESKATADSPRGPITGFESGFDKLADELANAINPLFGPMTDKQKVGMSRAWLRRQTKTELLTSIERSNFLDDVTAFREAMKEESQLSDIEIEGMVSKLFPKQGKDGANTLGVTKHRIPFDEQYVFNMKDKNGKDLRFTFEDMLDNNATSLLGKYVHDIVGRSALTQALELSKTSAAEKIETIPELLAKLERDAQAFGIRPEQYKESLDRIHFLLKTTAGYPTEDNSKVRSVLRTLRNMQVWRLLTSPATGVEALKEFMGTIPNQGISATFRLVPELPRLVGDVIKGKQPSQRFLMEAEMHAGIGVHGLNRKVFRMRREDGQQLGMKGKEYRSARIAEWSQRMSGNGAITDASNRIVYWSILQDFWQRAKTGEHLNERRLAAMGLSKEIEADIFRGMKEKASFKKGAFGDFIEAVNWDTWTGDLSNAAFSLSNAALKETSRQIIAPDPTQLSTWMSKEMGKVLTQFRRIPIAAHESKLLHSIQVRDARVFGSMTASAVFGTLAYIARTYYTSLSRPDRDEYLRKYLDPKKIALTVFSRADWSALIPTAVDVGSTVLRGKPVFAYSRSTLNQQNHADTGAIGDRVLGLIAQNPSTDQVAEAISAVGGFSRSIYDPDYAFSQDDMRHFKNGFAIPNAIGLSQMYDILGRALPQHSQ